MEMKSMNNIIPIEPAVDFNCKVDGRKLKASITHEEENGVQVIYHVAFSNGYKGVFVASGNSEAWIEDGKGHTVYAKAIEQDLGMISLFNRDNPPFAITISHNDESFNVWVVPGTDEEGKYSVYYKNDFRFDVEPDEDDFIVSTIERHRGYINQDIARIVKANLSRLNSF